MARVYEDYNGMPCVGREINPDNWTWTYLYDNKLAKKNQVKYTSLQKEYTTLNGKISKNTTTIGELFGKFCDKVILMMLNIMT